MKNIVAFIGSPRKNGYSTRLLNQVLDGAKASGAEVVIYDLNADGIKGCQGCFYCRSHEGCATNDVLQPMYADIQEADGIVATFPLYFANVGGQAKIWLDRLYPMIDGKFAARYPGKKAITIFSQGNKDENLMKGTIDETNGFFKMYGWDFVNTFLIFDTHNPQLELSDELMKEAFEAGKNMLGQ